MCSLTDFESDSVGIMFKVGLFVEAAQRAMVPGTPSSSDTVTSRRSHEFPGPNPQQDMHLKLDKAGQ